MGERRLFNPFQDSRLALRRSDSRPNVMANNRTTATAAPQPARIRWCASSSNVSAMRSWRSTPRQAFRQPCEHSIYTIHPHRLVPPAPTTVIRWSGAKLAAQVAGQPASAGRGSRRRPRQHERLRQGAARSMERRRRRLLRAQVLLGDDETSTSGRTRSEGEDLNVFSQGSSSGTSLFADSSRGARPLRLSPSAPLAGQCEAPCRPPPCARPLRFRIQLTMSESNERHAKHARVRRAPEGRRQRIRERPPPSTGRSRMHMLPGPSRDVTGVRSLPCKHTRNSLVGDEPRVATAADTLPRRHPPQLMFRTDPR